MDIAEGIEHLPDLSSGTAVAIGNFDGMHPGHEEILKELVNRGSEWNLATYILTFCPHPRKALGNDRLELIQTHEQRLNELKQHAVEGILLIKFDQKFARLTPRQFIEQIIADALHARVVVVGENFRFGQERRGSVGFLKSQAGRYGFQVISVPSVIVDGVNISSSHIRRLLKKGDIETANRFLGRPYVIDGTVIKGESTGKTLGFPTANIRTKNEILPAGVFVTRTRLRSRWIPSLTNVGHRPTFQRKGKHVESHLIDFTEDLYGQNVTISFHKKIRNERRFESPRSLTAQIRKDLQAARSFFQL